MILMVKKHIFILLFSIELENVFKIIVIVVFFLLVQINRIIDNGCNKKKAFKFIKKLFV